MATNPTSNLGVQNWYQDTLSSAIAAGDTTIPINNLPSPTEGYLVIDPDNASTREVIHYNSKTGSAVVCPSSGDRGLDGTTAQSHAQNTTVRMEFTTSYYNALKNGYGMASPFNLGSGSLASTALTNPYKFSVYRNAAWNTGTANQFNKVSFDTKSFDTGSNYDATTNFRFTAPIAGFYQLHSSVSSANSNAYTRAAFYKNGSLLREGSSGNDAAGTVNANRAVSGLFQLAANDYIEVYYFDNGATQTGSVGAAYTYFEGFLVSAT